MSSLKQETLEIINYLQALKINPILYGSQGVSLYIGQFKQFGDIDFLVEGRWLEEDWQALIAKMADLGFGLTDEHEHEFIRHDGVVVAFASSKILVRDHIVDSVSDATLVIKVEDIKIQTLKPEAFLKAYEFSAKDGYRKEVRYKKDEGIILLLKAYLSKSQ